MNFNINNIYEQIVSYVNNLSRKTKITSLIICAVTVLFCIGITVMLNNKPYEMLFGGLTVEESSEIMGKLQEMNITYKYDQNGTISVPKNQEPQVKAQLISEGYPKSGFTYDVFKENINMMSTDFEKQAYKLFELQNRMEATIRLFDGVKDATVNIAQEEATKYVLSSDTKSKATASVVVIMKNGGSPSLEQAKGIKKLVAGGIQGMEAEDVTVIDGNGQEVFTDELSTQAGLTKVKLEIQRDIENSIKTKVLHMLEPIFGADKVRVSVAIVVDLDKKIKEVIEYIPDGDTGKGVLSNQDTSYELSTNGEITGGIPGVDSNADVPVYPTITTDGSEIYIKDERSMDYLVSQVKEQVQSDSGEVTDIAVTVVVDSASMSNAQMRSLENLVATTAGISLDNASEKVEIYNISLPTGDIEVLPETIDGIPNWAIIALAVLIVLLIILIIFLVARKISKKNKKEEIETIDIEKIRQEEAEALKNSLKVQEAQQENVLKSYVSDFTSTNPEIAAQLIRTWLRGEDS